MSDDITEFCRDLSIAQIGEMSRQAGRMDRLRRFLAPTIDRLTAYEATNLALSNLHSPELLRRAETMAKHAVAAGSWWCYRGTVAGTGRFSIAGQIDDEASGFIRELRKFKKVLVEVDCAGGDARGAFAVADCLRNDVDAEVIVLVADSAGCVLSCGARRVGIAPTGRMMIHVPKCFCTYSTVAELRRVADDLERTVARVRELLRLRCSLDHVDQWLGDGDYSFIGEQAVAVGLADYVIASEDARPSGGNGSSAVEKASLDSIDDRLGRQMALCLTQLRIRDRAALAELLAPLVNPAIPDTAAAA